MEKKNKKYMYVIMVIIGLLIITIGVSYALWIMRSEQKEENILSTSCLDIELNNEEDNISLKNTIPISDDEGKTLKPYKFTIRNKCNDYVDYSINLEMLNETTIQSNNIKVLLNKIDLETNPKILSEYPQNEISKIKDGKESRQLTIGRLRKLENVNYELRLWIKEELTKESGIENQIAKSKIVVEGKVGNQVASDYIEELAKTDETNLIYDNTKDNNLRYIGSNPNNYIDIGDKDIDGQSILWRIIGVMNNIISLGDIEKQESLIKIIRADSIGDYSWDSSIESINDGYGVNEWSESDIMKLLNPITEYNEKPKIGASLYWKKEKGLCYNESNESNISCDFTTNGLSEEAKEKIAKVRWNTGTVGEIVDYNKLTAKYIYKGERSNHSGKEQCAGKGFSGCNDEVERTTTWDGYIGLMYLSDYGYAVGGDVRTECLETSMNSYNNDKCNINDWLNLKTNSGFSWTMTPVERDGYSNSSFGFYMAGNVLFYDCKNSYGIRPTAYLKSDVKIVENNNTNVLYGSKENPFRLQI